MRICIGTNNIGNAIPLLAQGFRDLGHQVTTAIMHKHRLFAASTADVMLEEARFVQMQDSVAVKPDNQVHDLIQNHDLFVFLSGSGLMKRFIDLPKLKELGKKIVIFPMGSEIRHEVVCKPFYEFYGYPFPKSDYQRISEDRRRMPPEMLGEYEHSYVNKSYTIRMAEMYADAIFGHIPCNLMGMRPFFATVMPYDYRICKCSIPGRVIPHIIHAPTKRVFKGTGRIIQALTELREEGIAFTFECLENRQNHEVLQALQNADVLIDQIGCAGGYGTLAQEGLSSGCAVIGCNNVTVPYPEDCPIVRATPATIKEILRTILTNQDLRILMAVMGRKWMEQGATAPKLIAQRVLQALDGSLNHEYFPVAFTSLVQRVPDEPLPEHLQKMTFDILLKYGAHPDVNLKRLIYAGVIPKDCHERLKLVPRWNIDDMQELVHWVWCSKDFKKVESNTLDYFLQRLGIK